jgi:hypothetical protein
MPSLLATLLVLATAPASASDGDAAPQYACTTFPVRSTMAMGAFQAPADVSAAKLNATTLPPGWVPMAGSVGSGGAFVIACRDLAADADAPRSAAPPAAATPPAPLLALPADAHEGTAATTASNGLCGRFAEDALVVPAGFGVIACSEGADTDALVLRGTGTPADACAFEDAWAKRVGWSVTTASSTRDAVADIYTRGAAQLVLACSVTGPQTLVALSIGPR